MTRTAATCALRWSGRVSLTPRILAVNIFALALLAGGFFYLDSYRSRIVDGRVAQASREARLIAEAMRCRRAGQRDAARAAAGARHRHAAPAVRSPTARCSSTAGRWALRNVRAASIPTSEDWRQDAARFLDAMIDTVVGAPRAAALSRARATARAWPDVADRARDTDRARDGVARARPHPGHHRRRAAAATAAVVHDDRQRARHHPDGARSSASGSASCWRSSRSCRSCCRCSWRARSSGRCAGSRAPRCACGWAARARSWCRACPRGATRSACWRARCRDMSQALRARIDATEAFAADVTHEMKNPLASLRSAVDGLERGQGPGAARAAARRSCATTCTGSTG